MPPFLGYFVPEFSYLLLLPVIFCYQLLVLCFQVFVIQVQSFKVLGLLILLLVYLASGVVFLVFLLLEFFFEPLDFGFRRSPELILLLQQFPLFFLQPVI